MAKSGLFQLFLAAAAKRALAGDLSLATFDGAAGTTFNFVELNDPVMGGKSTGTWHVDSAQHVGVFDGEVVDVPSLKAPGFIKAAADGKFVDVSSALDGDLVLTVRSTTPEYKGFRVSLAAGTLAPSYACAGGGSIPLSRGCFKTKFSVPSGDEFVEIRVPFKSFSDKWSPATGEQTTTCADDSDVCLTAKALSAIKRVEVWAEGVAGKCHLEIQKIAARSASGQDIVALPSAADSVMSSIGLATFDGASTTTFNFVELNDPVMGGQSTGTWKVDSAQKVGVFDGQVNIVPSLKAPGFIKAAADGKFADVSAAADGELVLLLRTTTPEYKGFRFAFVSGSLSPSYACSGGGQLPFSRGCFKAKFSVPESGEQFTEVRIPFKSFSDKWSPATGEQTATCANDADVCPTGKKLSAIKRLEIWAEGAVGKVHLEVKSISVASSSTTYVLV